MAPRLRQRHSAPVYFLLLNVVIPKTVVVNVVLKGNRRSLVLDRHRVVVDFWPRNFRSDFAQHLPFFAVYGVAFNVPEV
jgi:hypothetical protein